MFRILKLNESNSSALHEDSDLDNEDVEDIAAEDVMDSIEDDSKNEDYALNSDLDALRDILVDLDWNLYMVLTGNDDETCYVIGRMNGGDTEFLSYNGDDNFSWVVQPMSYRELSGLGTVYTNEGNENHDKIMNYLMNSLVDIAPEKVEKHAEDDSLETDETSDIGDEDIPDTAGISLDDIENINKGGNSDER